VFGARFNVKKLTVSKWESGEFTPKHEHLALLNSLFQQVLGEEDDPNVETAAYQLLLPFDQSVNVDFRVSPHSAESVRLAVAVRRRVG
jgi:hypothetical protein